MALRDFNKRTLEVTEQALTLALFIAGIAAFWAWGEVMYLSPCQKEWITYLMLLCGGLGTLASITKNPHLCGETLESALLKEISVYTDYAHKFMIEHKGQRLYVSNIEFQYWLKQVTRFVAKTQDDFFRIAFPYEAVSEALEGFFQNVQLLHQFEKGIKEKFILLNPSLTIQEIHHYGFKDYLRINSETKRSAKKFKKLTHPAKN